VWLWIIVIVAGFTIALGAIGSYVGDKLDTPWGKGFMAGFKNALWAKAGVSSPGAKAVGKAGKCQNASVVASEDIGDISDAGPLDMDFVICILPAMGDEPSCDDLASTYVDAAHPTRKFMIEVKHLTKSKMTCQRTYDPVGTLITDYLTK
jgi:hypothetical protein